MPQRLRIYLDTSVISALGDSRWPDRQSLTQSFFERLADFDAATSEVTRTEILDTPDESRRQEMLRIYGSLRLVDVTPEARVLSRRYIDAGIFPIKVEADALHVAVAVLAKQDIIVSWNFKHLVNRRRRAAVQSINQTLGFDTPEILPPAEL
jgi:predicted nucleic acid-binding protein